MSSRPLAARRPLAAPASSPLPARARRVGVRGSRPAVPAIDLAMQYWHRAFHQFHTESATYTTVALRLVPGEAAGRCAYEVARCRMANGITWLLICWEVDVPGIQFCDCADQDEAMALLAEPGRAAGRWYGVRLAQRHGTA